MSDRYVIVDCPQCNRPPDLLPDITANATITIPEQVVCGLCFGLHKVRVAKSGVPVIRWVEYHGDLSVPKGGFWACDETAIGRLGALTDEDESCPE